MLEGSEPLCLVEGMVEDGSQKAGGSSGDKNHGIYCVFEVSLPEDGHLCFLGNGYSLYLVALQRLYKILNILVLHVSRVSAVDHDGVAVVVIDEVVVLQRYHP